MKRSALAVLAIAVVVPATPAHAYPDPTGVLCAVTSANDTTGLVNGDLDFQVGVLRGGPLVLVDDSDPLFVHNGSMTCSIQVGGWRHLDPDAVTVIGPGTPGAVLVAPTLVGYLAGPFADVYVCTRVDVFGYPTLYWDAWSSAWSTSSFAECDLRASTSLGHTRVIS